MIGGLSLFYITITMNREIKFRAITENPNKNKNHKPYFVFGLIERTEDKEFPYSIDGCFIKPETIGQYTGLKDKNGIEIYEGDILGLPNNNLLQAGKYQVFYYKDAFVTSNVLFKDLKTANKILLSWAIDKGAFVIGNKYE